MIYLALWTDGIGAVSARAFKTAESRDKFLALQDVKFGPRERITAAFGGWEALDAIIEG